MMLYAKDETVWVQLFSKVVAGLESIKTAHVPIGKNTNF